LEWSYIWYSFTRSSSTPFLTKIYFCFFLSCSKTTDYLLWANSISHSQYTCWPPLNKTISNCSSINGKTR
jgi:hypothetical protein